MSPVKAILNILTPNKYSKKCSTIKLNIKFQYNYNTIISFNKLFLSYFCKILLKALYKILFYGIIKQ